MTFSEADRPDRTLVLLPGLDGTGELFEPFVEALPASVRALVVAYPPAAPLDLAEHARIVASRLPEGRVVLLAESFSGLVAMSLLAEGLPRVEAVVFCNAFAGPPRPWLLRLAGSLPALGHFLRMPPAPLLRCFCAGWRATAAQIAWIRRCLAQVSPEVLARRLRLVASHRCAPPARRDVPCLYLQGRGDRLVPSRAARWFGQQFTRCRLEQVDGPHFLLQIAPRECAACVARLLDDLDGPAAGGTRP